MSQALAKIYLHLIFSTKNRERSLPDDIRPDLHSYMGGILNGLGCSPIEINTEPDHVHLLFVMTRTETISNIVGQLKKSSNDWLRSRDQKFRNFYWQGGYGIFSVSQSAVEEVRAYIRSVSIINRFRSRTNTLLFSNDTKLNSMNDMFGINSRAPSGRYGLLPLITQGITLARSALGYILAARWAAIRGGFIALRHL